MLPTRRLVRASFIFIKSNMNLLRKGLLAGYHKQQGLLNGGKIWWNRATRMAGRWYGG